MATGKAIRKLKVILKDSVRAIWMAKETRTGLPTVIRKPTATD